MWAKGTVQAKGNKKGLKYCYNVISKKEEVFGHGAGKLVNTR